MRMKFWAAIVFFGLCGCVALEPMEVREEIYGKSIPVITQSFASKKLNPSETWKIYLNASDEGGRMKNIVCTLDQPGLRDYSASITRIKPENRKELSGYIYLNSSELGNQLNFLNIGLTVQIQDMAGHYSEPVRFPLSFHNRFAQEAPPKGVFKEQDLGPIMTRLQLIDSGTEFH